MPMINAPLFPDHFPLVNNETELDSIKQAYPPPEFDPYYIASACIEQRRLAFESLWQEFGQFADRHFLDQVKRQFHQRTWEMYVGRILSRAFDIESDDSGPDFTVNNQLYIECVCCTVGSSDNPNSVPSIISDGQVRAVPQHPIFLRVASVFKEKADKYTNWLQRGIISDDKPYVIAINIGELGYIEPSDRPWVMSTLLGINGIVYYPDTGEQEFARLLRVEKKDGGSVPIAQFCSRQYDYVSGVLFSNQTVLSHLLSKPNEYHFINNPYARTPVSPLFASRFDRWQTNANTDGSISILRLPAI